MKSFEEYINEASQNYIFGGTDDRNTEIKQKTFGELIPGDSFYWVSSYSDFPTMHKFKSIKIVKGNTEICYDDDGVKGKYTMPGNILYETCFVYEESYGVWITATNEKEFIETVNSNIRMKKIMSTDIK